MFTLGQNFPLDKVRDLVDDLHKKHQHYIVMVDPGKTQDRHSSVSCSRTPAVAAQDYGPYNRGLTANAFLKTSAGVPWKGEVWPGTTVFRTGSQQIHMTIGTMSSPLSSTKTLE